MWHGEQFKFKEAKQCVNKALKIYSTGTSTVDVFLFMRKHNTFVPFWLCIFNAVSYRIDRLNRDHL